LESAVLALEWFTPCHVAMDAVTTRTVVDVAERALGARKGRLRAEGRVLEVVKGGNFVVVAGYRGFRWAGAVIVFERRCNMELTAMEVPELAKELGLERELAELGVEGLIGLLATV